jgi:hypothetical protein
MAASAHAATVVNGPIAYNDGTHWSEVRADGTGRMTVTPSGGGFVAGDPIQDATFSPDGSWAVFADHATGALWLSWADGTHARQLAAGAGQLSGDPRPAWSPDLKTIVFSRYDAASGTTQLWSVPSDGSAAPSVLVAHDGACGADNASFAPNGDLAYTWECDLGGGGLQVAVKVIDPATKTVKRTIPDFRNPQFSPDGTKLVAFSQPAGKPLGNAYLMASDGTGAVALNSDSVTGCTNGAAVAWSPDGLELASARCVYPSDGGPQQISVYVQAAAAGSAEKVVLPLTDASTSLADIAWGPDFSAPTTQNPGRPDPARRPYTLRLGGTDRVGTAIAVADAAYGPSSKAKAKVAVLSRSDNYADALAGNALAAQKEGPLLLTGGAKLDPAVSAELGKLLAQGSTVYVLGGDGALSPQVEAGIRALGLTPKRLAGSDRFETATKIAAEISAHPHTVLVATGMDAPDALAAGAAAATDPNGGVVLLTDGKALPGSTAAYLAGVNPAAQKVYGVGVQGVDALNMVRGFAGHFTPLAGLDRYATDIAVASNATLYPRPTVAALATGLTWPDALSGGAYAGALHAPLLLTDGALVPAGAGLWLHAHGLDLSFMPVFGGPKAVPGNAVTWAGTLAWGADRFDVR